jgi:ABC-type phosphate transport system permease subunit
MQMISTFLVFVSWFVLVSFVIIPILIFAFGFWQGWQGGNNNGFSDFVNSNRWSDNK